MADLILPLPTLLQDLWDLLRSDALATLVSAAALPAIATANIFPGNPALRTDDQYPGIAFAVKLQPRPLGIALEPRYACIVDVCFRWTGRAEDMIEGAQYACLVEQLIRTYSSYGSWVDYLAEETTITIVEDDEHRWTGGEFEFTLIGDQITYG